jgi:c(7)-type cytochrome triheme protein
MDKKGFIILLLAAVFSGLVLTSSSNAEYGDIILNNNPEGMIKAGVKPVIFPHWFHRIRFKCKVCHEEIFVLKKGANNINMGTIMAGEYCGKCHNGLVAWEPLYCDRCHLYEGK